MTETTEAIAANLRQRSTCAVHDTTKRMLTEAADLIDAQRAEIERLTKELAKEEATCGDVIDQRDAAEKALSDLFSMVTGRPPEWSNLFGYSEALDECEEELSASQERGRVMREALTQIARSPVSLPDEEDADGWATLASDRREIARAALQPQETADDR